MKVLSLGCKNPGGYFSKICIYIYINRYNLHQFTMHTNSVSPDFLASRPTVYVEEPLLKPKFERFLSTPKHLPIARPEGETGGPV